MLDDACSVVGKDLSHHRSLSHSHSLTHSLTHSLSHPILAYHNPRPLILILILIGSLALTSSTGFYLLIVTPPLTHAHTHS